MMITREKRVGEHIDVGNHKIFMASMCAFSLFQRKREITTITGVEKGILRNYVAW
jgi:hypothetical protein